MNENSNHLEKSQIGPNAKRTLKVNGKTILWSHFKTAYNWDQEKQSIKYKYLSEQYFRMDGNSRMRDHLKEDVLNSEMHNLMQA